MPSSLRRFLGAWIILIFLLLYILLAVNLRFLLPEGVWIDLFYYLIFGVLWVYPALAIAQWSHRTVSSVFLHKN